jgi:hypothetical protein
MRGLFYDTIRKAFALIHLLLNLMRIALLLALYGIVPITTFAQTGGTTIYQFLTIQPNARIAALGGYGIANPDPDMNLAIQNPSLLCREMNNQTTFNYVSYVAGISAGYAGYTHHFDSIGTFATGIQYISYGTFTKTSSNGEVIGDFTAGEYCAHLSYAKNYGPFSVGGAVKMISSSLEEYTSLGLAADAAVTYYNRRNLLTITGVISNYGKQVQTYRKNNAEELPLNVQIGISKKLLRAPLRFSIIANHLEKPGQLIYQNANKPGLTRDLETGELQLEDIGIMKKTLSHLHFSGEILLSKNFYIGMGFNYLRRWELKLDEMGGFAGFSWGFGFKVSKFQVAYGHTGYNVGYGTDHFSFIVYMSEFFKKKQAG